MEWLVLILKPDGKAEMVISRDLDEIRYQFEKAKRNNWTTLEARVINQYSAVRVGEEETTKVVALGALA